MSALLPDDPCVVFGSFNADGTSSQTPLCVLTPSVPVTPLPATGSTSAPIVGGGITFVLLGVCLVAVAARRKATT